MIPTPLLLLVVIVDVTDTISLLRNDAVFVNITGVTDNFVVAGSYSDSTDTISLLMKDGGFVNVTGVTDTFTTGGTYSTGTLTLDRNDGSSVLVTGFLTGNTLQEVLVNGNTSGGNDIIMTEGDDVVFKYAGWNNRIKHKSFNNT